MCRSEARAQWTWPFAGSFRTRPLFARAIALALGIVSAGAFASEPRFQRIASGVFVAIAPNEAASPANGGFVSNLGFIVGRTGVVVIGTGASERHGAAILRAIRATTRKPVVLAVNLQATADHVLGNRVFMRRGVPILAHRETQRFMARNCTTCIGNARRAIGGRRMGAAAIAQPETLIEATRAVEYGGRELEVIHYGVTFQPGSLAVLDRATGILFAGEMLSLDRIPDVRNADLANWRTALQAIAGSSVSRLVPAHGPVSAPHRALDSARYLADLWSAVQAVYERGVALQDAASAAALPAHSRRALYEPLHRGNVHFTYLRVEADDLAR